MSSRHASTDVSSYDDQLRSLHRLLVSVENEFAAISALPSSVEHDRLRRQIADVAKRIALASDALEPEPSPSPSPPPPLSPKPEPRQDQWESPGDAAVSKQRNVQEKVDDRARTIIDAAHRDPITPSDFVLLYLTNPARTIPRKAPTHAQLEDAAFVRLLRGYSGSRQDWVNALTLVPRDAGLSFRALASGAIACDKIPGHEDRLIARNAHLSRITYTDAATHWTVRLVQLVGAIKFAIDWNARADAITSRLYKSAFFENCFQRDHAYEALFHDLNDHQRARKMDDLELEFKRWKKAYKTVVTARNRALKLYNQFGVAVLFDPLWTVDNLIRRSPEWPHLVAYLSDKVPSDDGDFEPAVVQVQDELATTLTHVLDVLGDVHIQQLVRDFLSRYPPSFR